MLAERLRHQIRCVVRGHPVALGTGDTAGALFEQATTLINEAPVPEAIIADPHYVTSSRAKTS